MIGQAQRPGFLRSVSADYAHLYGGRSESALRQAARSLPRFMTNPSLHAVVLMRCALHGPRWLDRLCRRRLFTGHSIHVGVGCEFGPGLLLPHPFCIRFGESVIVGQDVSIYHNVRVGIGAEAPYVTTIIGDRVVIHANSSIAPGVTVGDDSVVGANSYVDQELPASGLFARGRIRSSVGRALHS